MDWISKNIYHLAIALTFILAGVAIVNGHRIKRRRGQPLNTTDRAIRIGAILLALTGCIVLGILIAH